MRKVESAGSSLPSPEADSIRADHLSRAHHSGVAEVLDVPHGYQLNLPGGRSTRVREVQGPPGAPTVMLLHGLGATGGLNWAGAFSVLGQHFRVIALDHRGHGRGPRTRRFRLEDCADDARDVADALGITRCTAVGYSMGGPIAMLMWRRHPRLVRGLVLIATSRNFRGHPAERAGFEALALAASLPTPPRLPIPWPRQGHLVGRVVPGLAPVLWGIDEFRHHQRSAVLQAAAAIGRFTAHDWVGEIDVPVAVVATTNDRLVPLARQARLAMAIPTAVLHPVPAGHLRTGPLGSPDTVREIDVACREVVRRSRQWSSVLQPKAREAASGREPA